MKIRLLFLSLCFSVLHVQGQDKECAAKAVSVDSLVSAGKLDRAFELWKSSRQCVSESLYRSGEKILTYNLSTNLSEADKAAQSAMLAQLYSDYERNFPGNGSDVKKAMHLYRENKSATEVYGLLDNAFLKSRDRFTDANALQIYFDQLHTRFSAKQITEEVYLEKTDAITAHLDGLFATSKNNDYRNVSESIGRISSSVLTCEKREANYEKQYATKQTDANWLQSAVTGLSKNCQRSAFYYKAAAQWYAVSPNAKSAFHLAQASTYQRKSGDASKYFAIAADAETDPAQKAEIFYTLAVREISNGPKAIDYLKQSLKVKPDFGKAYLLLAEVYSTIECGKNDLEKKARYTLAAQTALKAGKVDKTLVKTSESVAAKFRKNAPTSGEIKDAKMAGKTVSFACGINESVTLP